MVKRISERNTQIKQQYLKEIEIGKNSDVIMDELSSSYNIGKFYVRTILKDQGIELERKTEYSRSDKNKLEDRDDEIVELFNKETDPESIALKYELTPTRVRQILRNRLGKSDSKHAQLNAKLDEIKLELEKGVPYKTIVKKYGKETIKQIQAVLKFKIFKKSLEIKTKDIVQMAIGGIPPKDIAAKHEVTLNYTYMILHDNGIRFKISAEDKIKRDKKIAVEKGKGKSVEDIAEKHGLTSTMVRIILSNHKLK